MNLEEQQLHIPAAPDKTCHIFFWPDLQLFGRFCRPASQNAIIKRFAVAEERWKNII